MLGKNLFFTYYDINFIFAHSFTIPYNKTLKRRSLTLKSFDIEIKTQIKAQAEDVFAALIEGKKLNTWFCTKSKLEPRPGGLFIFGGSYAFPQGAEEVIGKISVFSPPERFSFVWPLQNSLSRAIFLIKQVNDEAVTLILNHEDIPTEIDPINIYNAWVIYLSNLKLLLEDQKLGLRFNYRKSLSPSGVRQRIKIHRPLEQVFEAMTNPFHLDQWIANGSIVENAPGGLYRWGWQIHGPKSISTITENKTLVLNWEYKSKESLVMFEFAPRKDYTLVRLTHLDLPKKTAFLYHQGWPAYLNMLKVYLETKKGTFNFS